MTAEQTMREAAAEAGIEAPVRFDEVTESTNSTALRLAAQSAPEWSVVVAGHQTGGRGRLGRTWVSEPGNALLCSVILRPAGGLESEYAGLLTLLAGVAMVEAVRVACGSTVACKWPNDIMLGEKKAGGLLAESLIEDGRLEVVVIGAGINVLGAPADVAEAAAIGRPGDDPAKLLTAFLFCLKQRYEPASPTFVADVVTAYGPVCATLGREVSASTLDGRRIEGRATAIDEKGNLLVDSQDGRETVGFGEIDHLSR